MECKCTFVILVKSNNRLLIQWMKLSLSNCWPLTFNPLESYVMVNTFFPLHKETILASLNFSLVPVALVMFFFQHSAVVTLLFCV